MKFFYFIALVFVFAVTWMVPAAFQFQDKEGGEWFDIVTHLPLIIIVSVIVSGGVIAWLSGMFLNNLAFRFTVCCAIALLVSFFVFPALY
jgi:hypothetical protein